MTAEEKKAAKDAKAAKSKARSDKTQEKLKQDTEKAVMRFFELYTRAGVGLLFFLRLLCSNNL